MQAVSHARRIGDCRVDLSPMTHEPDTYEIASLGFVADDIIFAVAGARDGTELSARDADALELAQSLLKALATLDDDQPPSRSSRQLRGLVATRQQAMQAVRGVTGSHQAFKERLLEMSDLLGELRGNPGKQASPERYDTILDLFETLSQFSLVSARHASEGSRPAWMSSLPTGLY